jgi:hypothetical protein
MRVCSFFKIISPSSVNSSIVTLQNIGIVHYLSLPFLYTLSQYIIASEYCGDYVEDLIDLCECVINVYTALMEGNYENSDLLFTCVNALCDHVDLL